MSWGRWRIMLLGVVWITSVHAWTWHDGWQTRDQQAQAYFNTGDYAKAAEVFQRSDWRATATYRAQNYQQAAQLYEGVQTADGYYNAGNALAKMGQYQPAIAAYDQALQRDAHHADALFNKQIVEKLLKQQEQSKQDPKQDQSKPNQSADPSSQSESEKPSQSPPKPEQEAKQPKSEPKQAKQAESSAKKESSQQQKPRANRSEREDQQAKEQWLRLIPDDPAYLLREKFMRDHLKRQQGSAS